MSKGKGKSFERLVSKKMSLWLTCGEDKDCIWLTKSSGGRATRRIRTNQKASKYDHGDIAPDGSRLEYFFNVFSVELKTGYGQKKESEFKLWSVLDLIDSKQNIPKFKDFWDQACQDAIASKREPILIFRRNRRLPCIAMHDYIFNTFLNSSFINFPIITSQLETDVNPIVICNLEQFFDSTWKKINENFIKLKINRAIFKNKNTMR